jgi:hypothetical protein
MSRIRVAVIGWAAERCVPLALDNKINGALFAST